MQETDVSKVTSTSEPVQGEDDILHTNHDEAVSSLHSASSELCSGGTGRQGEDLIGRNGVPALSEQRSPAFFFQQLFRNMEECERQSFSDSSCTSHAGVSPRSSTVLGYSGFRGTMERQPETSSPMSSPLQISSTPALTTFPNGLIESERVQEKMKEDTKPQPAAGLSSLLLHPLDEPFFSYDSSYSGDDTGGCGRDALRSLGSVRVVDIRRDTKRYGSYADQVFEDSLHGPVEELKAELLLPDVAGDQNDGLRRLVFRFTEGLSEDLRGEVWRRLLDVQTPDLGTIEKDLAEPSTVDEDQQRVIWNDVVRTRAHLPLFKKPETRAAMKSILMYICKTQNITYKQGLNEAFAPFFFITSPSFTVPIAVACFNRFLFRYLPYVHDDDFQALQCSFVLFQQLLTYHDPYLASYLVSHHVLPEMYVTPWFLTLFASKTQINILLCLWDYYIAENDRFLCCFIALALLLQSRSVIFVTEVSLLPETLAQMGFRSYGEMHMVWTHAKMLKCHTPSSFNARNATAQALGSTIETTNGQFVPDLSVCLSHSSELFYMLPREVITHCYGLTTSRPEHPAMVRSWKLFLLDLRPREAFDTGRLPLAISADVYSNDWKTTITNLVPFAHPAAASSPAAGFPTLADDRVKGDEEEGATQCHICLMGEGTPGDDESLTRQVYNFLVKELCLPRVSVAQGGYRAAHAAAKQLKLELIDHDPFCCGLCRSSTDVSDTQKGNERKHWFSVKSNSSTTLGSPREVGTPISADCKTKRGSVYFPTPSSLGALALMPSFFSRKMTSKSSEAPAKTTSGPDEESSPDVKNRTLSTLSKPAFFCSTGNPFSLSGVFTTPYLLSSTFKILEAPISQDNWRTITSRFAHVPVSYFGTESLLVAPCYINAIAVDPCCRSQLTLSSQCVPSSSFFVPTRRICQLIVSPKRIALASKILPPGSASVAATQSEPQTSDASSFPERGRSNSTPRSSVSCASSSIQSVEEVAERIVVEYAGFPVQDIFKVVLVKSSPEKAGFYFLPQPNELALSFALTFLDANMAFRALRHIRQLYRSMSSNRTS